MPPTPAKRPVGPAKGSVPKPGPKVTTTAAIKIDFPTEPSLPPMDLKNYICMFFGAPGVGKSTFSNGLAPRVLFLSTDRGTRYMNAMRIECLTWAKFMAVADALEAGEASKYDMVCIDHVDDWASMAESATLQQLNIQALTDAGYGKGWSVMKSKIKRFMEIIKRVNLGLVFIAHEDTKTVKVNGLDVDRCMPKMSKQAWDAIIPLADLVGYIGMMPVKGPDGKRKEIRYITTEPRQDLYAKDRTLRRKPKGRNWEKLDPKEFMATFTAPAVETEVQ